MHSGPPGITSAPSPAKRSACSARLTRPCPAGEWLWFALLGALAATALLVGRGRERLSVVLLPVAAVAVTMVMSVVYREIGPLHARYVLPFLVLVPLWCGEVVLRRRDNLPQGWPRRYPS